MIHRQNLAMIVVFSCYSGITRSLQRQWKENILIWRAQNYGKSGKTVRGGKLSSVMFPWVVNAQTDKNSDRINEQRWNIHTESRHPASHRKELISVPSSLTLTIVNGACFLDGKDHNTSNVELIWKQM